MATETMKIVELDCTTQKTVERDMTTAEIKAHEERSAALAEQRAADEIAAKAEADTKKSALAKLTALGLTAEEAKAITN